MNTIIYFSVHGIRMNNPKQNEKQISVKFTKKDMEQIERAVQNGHGMNIVDFVRSATREKIVELGIQPESEKTVQVVFGEGGGP